MSSISSTERAARHTIRHLSHASIVYPAANVPSRQAGSPEPSFLVEDGVNSVEGPVDQIHNFSVWRAVQWESLNRSDNTGEQAGKIREDGEWKMRPPPLSARREEVDVEVEQVVLKLSFLIWEMHQSDWEKLYIKCFLLVEWPALEVLSQPKTLAQTYTCYVYCVKLTETCYYSTCISLLFCWFWLLPLSSFVSRFG